MICRCCGRHADTLYGGEGVYPAMCRMCWLRTDDPWALCEMLDEALRLTQEYVGRGLLPDLPGWAHHDARQVYREAREARAQGNGG